MNMARPAACTRTKAAARTVSCSSRRSRLSNSVRFSVPITSCIGSLDQRPRVRRASPGSALLWSGWEPRLTTGAVDCVAEMPLPLRESDEAMKYRGKQETKLKLLLRVYDGAQL